MNQLKNLFIASALCVGVSSCSGPEKKVPAAIPSDPEIEANIKEWLGKMTLEEKIGQMCEITIDVVSDFEESKKHGFVLNPAMLDTVIGKYKVGSLLNVPLSIAQTKEKWAEAIKQIQDISMKEIGIPCIYGVDQIHGTTYTLGGTMFPQGINMASSFNRDLVRKGAEISAYETKAGCIPWTYAPVVDLGRLLQKSYTVDFLTKKKKVNEGEIPQYYVEGNHEAIIQPEVFELVQQELERRKNSRGRHSGVHLFSGKIKCGQCGEWYGSKVWHSNSKYRRVIWQCNHKYDGEEKCSTPHLTEDEIKTMFVSAVNKLISKKDAVIAPLRASLDIAFDTSALEAEAEELQSEIMVTSDLIQKCICENAHVALDQTEYQKRYDGLNARFDSAKAQLEEIDSAIADKKSRRATIEAFMDTLAQADLMEKFDPALWCGLVDFVTVYSADDIRITFRNGMEIKA